MAVDSSAAGLSILRTSAFQRPTVSLVYSDGSDLAREQRLTLFGAAAVAERATLGTERDLISADQQQQPSET